jgi:hypothetical protein
MMIMIVTYYFAKRTQDQEYFENLKNFISKTKDENKK